MLENIMKLKTNVAVVTAIIMLSATVYSSNNTAEDILCTTYPMYLLSSIVTENTDTFKPSLLIPASTGCPHSYVMSARDMKRISDATIIIANGAGLDDGILESAKRINPDIHIVNTSKFAFYHDSDKSDNSNLHKNHSSCNDEICSNHNHSEDSHNHSDHADHSDKVEKIGLDTLKTISNPHAFVNPVMMSKMVTALSEMLAEKDLKEASIYQHNAVEFKTKIDALMKDYRTLTESLEKTKIITHHSAFEYFVKETGFEVAGVIRGDPGADPAASDIIRLVKEIRKKEVIAVFLEPQFSMSVGRTIANEAGIPAIIIDSLASGPVNAGAGYYLQVMNKNLNSLKTALLKSDNKR